MELWRLSSAELTDLDRVVERKWYDIDREEIHQHTEGSVPAGREFYDAVDADPAIAVPGRRV
jgi:hypothetical protein